MTPTAEEMREWTAKLMGMTDCFCCNISNCQWWVKFFKNEAFPDGAYEHIIIKEDWHPDIDMNQTEMVWERMRELGWYLNLIELVNGGFFCSFMQVTGHQKPIIEEISPAHAIIKAAMAAMPEPNL